MKNTTLTESFLSDLIIQSLKETKNFEAFVPSIIEKVKLFNPYLTSRSKDFNLVINTFYNWNIFNVRNSVRDVASGFNCSRITVYNRINKTINSGGPNVYPSEEAS